MYKLPNYKEISQDIADYELPKWAEKYISVDKEKGNFEIYSLPLNSDALLKEFINAKGKIRKTLMKNTLENYPSKLIIETHAKDYVILNFLIGIIEQSKNRIRKLNGDLKANDGNGIQHWIPRCYMRNFATFIEGEEKVEVRYFEKNNSTNELVDLYDDRYFCEKKGNSGKYYSDKFEIILAKMEDDYGQVVAGGRKPKNMWDFLILSIFFSILHLRVDNSTGFHAKEIAIIALIPKIVSEYVLFIEDLTKKLEEDESIPFMENPAVLQYSVINDESYLKINSDGSIDIDQNFGSILYLFAPYDPKTIILFLPRRVTSIDEANSHLLGTSNNSSSGLIPYITTSIKYSTSSLSVVFHKPQMKVKDVEFDITVEDKNLNPEI